MNLHAFQECHDRLDKMNLIKHVTLQVLDNGRVQFLRQQEKHLWKEVPFRTAYDKVSHALRDGIKKTVFPTVKPMVSKPAPTPSPFVNQAGLVTPSPGQPDPMLLRRAEFELQQQQRQNNESSMLFQQQLQSLLEEIHRNDPTTPMLSRNYLGPLAAPYPGARASLPPQDFMLPPEFVPPVELPWPMPQVARGGEPMQNLQLPPEPNQNVRVAIRRRPEKDLGLDSQEDPLLFQGHNTLRKKAPPTPPARKKNGRKRARVDDSEDGHW
eukprot:CAMPEP_0194218502 /NCGR_PEP_ID=MMETSP0156-20130528/23926_1 /TAXON_ID=33649 /ORGANISM="Thalassionema nitzschioides, Strain L26-B" /LENGTH=267 /DNA_ID=CAMNT_0038947889 /DNA_START=512 /DNA_END=1312 /DNA_ORIENTATION=+